MLAPSWTVTSVSTANEPGGNARLTDGASAPRFTAISCVTTASFDTWLANTLDAVSTASSLAVPEGEDFIVATPGI